MEIVNGTNVYTVGEMAAEDEGYRLYLCNQKQAGRQCLLQIATAAKDNGRLDRAAYVLRELEKSAQALEEEYSRVKTDPKDTLNYGFGFPELLDSFVFEEQEGRRINILAFRNVENVGQMVPLINLTEKDHLRIDLRTSVWFLGKLLKLLVFAHSQSLAVDLITARNILFEPDKRYILLFDWSRTKAFSGGLPFDVGRTEIALAAQAIITALGGNPLTGNIPNDGDEGYVRYTNFLLRLARAGESNAQRAHERFYELADSIWKRGYYPFTTKPLTD